MIVGQARTTVAVSPAEVLEFWSSSSIWTGTGRPITRPVGSGR